MDMNVLNRQISDALAAHEGWKQRLGDAVRTGALPKPAREIKRDDQCAFGKWLHGMRQDPKISGQSGYKAVVEAHAAFHRCAGGVAEMVESGRKDAAGAALKGPEFGQATQHLKMEMSLWRQQVERQG